MPKLAIVGIMSTTIKESKKREAKLDEEDEKILGSFSSPSDSKHERGSYHIYVTNKRVMGIKIHPGLTAPKTPPELDSTPGVDFEIPRGAILRVTMRSAGQNRNLFVIQLRSAGALKILLRHSTNQELQKEKELFVDGFERKG